MSTASEVSESDGFSLGKLEPDLHTIPQGIYPGKVEDSTLNHRWGSISVERERTFGCNGRGRNLKVASNEQVMRTVMCAFCCPLSLTDFYVNLMSRPKFMLSESPRLLRIYWVSFRSL